MKYTSYENRKKTDALFCAAQGSAHYTGDAAEAIGYIEKMQLCDPVLWALFVDQFRIGNVDDHDNGWRCEFWGKMMRGACLTYAYTQSERLYTVLQRSVRDIISTQDKYGRISTFSIPHEFHGWDMWGRKYVLLGLQYFLEICQDDALADEAVACMCAQVDYLIEKIGNNEVAKQPITNTSEWWNGLNASSILEPIVRLYNLTGNEKYLKFAKGIIDAGGTRGYDIFEAMYEDRCAPYELPVTKAYEMISNFEGILEYYRATGEEKYKTMVINFARRVIDTDITVIGSAGTTHELFDHSKVRQFDPKFNGIMQETCVTVTWMKFCHQMLCLTGDPMYADQIETSLYNGFLGAINVNRNECPTQCTGQVFTFDSYSPLLNGWRGRAVGGRMYIVKEGQYWWGCCVAIGAAGSGLVPMVATMQARNGAAVNLYLPGDSETALPMGGTLKLHTETEYPVKGDIRMTVDTDATEPFAISVRIPAWSKNTTLTVNGEAVSANEGSYAVINRAWKTGDVIALTLDMRCAVIHAADLDPNADAESICHTALRRGPVMLARDSQTGEDIRAAVTIPEKDGYVELIPTEGLSFATKQAYKIACAEGDITVVDYPSCGQNWREDMPVTVWVTVK